MDLVVALAEDLVIDLVWSGELLSEWERVIVREGGRTEASVRDVAGAVRTFFASGRIDPSSYRNQVDMTPGRDPDDRVHTTLTDLRQLVAASTDLRRYEPCQTR